MGLQSKARRIVSKDGTCSHVSRTWLDATATRRQPLACSIKAFAESVQPAALHVVRDWAGNLERHRHSALCRWAQLGTSVSLSPRLGFQPEQCLRCSGGGGRCFWLHLEHNQCPVPTARMDER